ncbi:MAG: glycosyltransferase family 1 protein [Psychrobacter sp.]|nr:glycosyltransferase family 1 protein [Psychrobacter sp.]
MNTATYRPDMTLLKKDLAQDSHPNHSFNLEQPASINKQPQVDEGKLNPVKQRALTVVLVTETWVPDVNGVSLSLFQIMQQLTMLGHAIHLIRPKQAEQKSTTLATTIISSELMVKGVPIPRYPDLQFGMPAYHSIKHYLTQLQPDIIHIATEGPLGLAALVAAKRCHLPVTTGYHTQFHDFSKHFGFGAIAAPLIAYFKRFHNWSDATCVPSQKTQKDLAALGFKRLKQVGRGVDIERFNPDKRSEELRQAWGAGQQHTVLMMVSRLSPEKGVDVVISGYQALQMQQLHRATKLVIVGDGPDRARLEAMAKGNDDILFVGAKMKEDLAVHYASADAFVFASQVETFGNVVTEAMASGLPVYAFDDAAAGLLVDAGNGALVNTGNIKGFIAMVADLPKAQQLKQLGNQARQTVKGMSWAQPARQMLTMFIEAIGCEETSIITEPQGCHQTITQSRQSLVMDDKDATKTNLTKLSCDSHTDNSQNGLSHDTGSQAIMTNANITQEKSREHIGEKERHKDSANIQNAAKTTSLTSQLPIGNMRHERIKARITLDIAKSATS